MPYRDDGERTRGRRTLPLLEQAVQIAAPCSADWTQMQGDERSRVCAQCSQRVYNLSAMTRFEIADFLASRAGPTCVRLYRRADGTMLTADCPVGLRSRRRKRGALAGAAAIAIAGGGVLLATHASPPTAPTVASEPDPAPCGQPLSARLGRAPALAPLIRSHPPLVDPRAGIMGTLMGPTQELNWQR